jgi:hypothetical protein
MSDEHKAALAKGRMEGRVVRDYLEGLRATKPKRGRKRTPETIQKRLDAIDVELASASPLDELLLVQERRDLEAELAAKSDAIDMDALEADPDVDNAVLDEAFDLRRSLRNLDHVLDQLDAIEL